MGVGLVSGPELTWTGEGLCLLVSLQDPLCAHPRLSRSPRPRLLSAQPQRLPPCRGPRDTWASLRRVEKGPSSWGRKPWGTHPPSSQGCPGRAQVTWKSQNPRAASGQGSPGPASLPPSQQHWEPRSPCWAKGLCPTCAQGPQHPTQQRKGWKQDRATGFL